MQGPIVVGVEGSERSRDALAFAGTLAPLLGGELLIAHVHAYGELSSLLSEGEYERLVREVTDSTLAQTEDALPDGVGREMRLVEGRSPAAGLDRAVRDSDASLVVVGSSHRAGLGKVLPGAVANRLLSGSSVPVAIAPRGYAATETPSITSVTCGFDGSAESRQALSWVTKLARVASAQLSVLGVHTSAAFGSVSATGAFGTESVNSALRRRLQEEVEAAERDLPGDVQSTASVSDGDPAQVLAERSGATDLLVLGSRGYGPVRSVLLGSVSSHVVERSACPVVVVPRGATEAKP